MMTMLLVLTLGADGGSKALDVDALVAEVMHKTDGSREDLDRRLVELEARSKTARGDEKKLLDRAVALFRSEAPFDQELPQLLELIRDALALSKGDVATQRALVSAFLSLTMTAPAFGLDPEPLRKEAVERARALVTEHPKDAKARWVLASVLLTANAPERESALELRECARLDRSLGCRQQLDELLARLESPRCSGANAIAPISVVVKQGGKSTLSLSAADFASLTVTARGALLLTASPAAAQRLATETKARAKARDGELELRAGTVELASRLYQPIENGQLSVTPGSGKPPFVLEALCSKIERPKFDDLRP